MKLPWTSLALCFSLVALCYAILELALWIEGPAAVQWLTASRGGYPGFMPPLGVAAFVVYMLVMERIGG